MFPPTKAGFCDVFGNVWEWGEDHFNGFKDYKPHLLYDDFSTPCFDGRHNMIMVSYVSRYPHPPPLAHEPYSCASQE